MSIKDWEPFKASAQTTRHGGLTGNASENRMLGKVGGANTIRKEFQNNADGSVTMLQTRNGFPEFTTTGDAEQKYENWAWPWHGLERQSTAGPRVIETPSGEIATKGVAPGTAMARGFNFVLSKIGAGFASIPPPTTNPLGTTWGNWAAITNGVLFGENVGMNTWLYTTGSTAYVVSMIISGTATATLTFYTLSNWVEGMSGAAATDFVKYDKKPTPYMVKNKPSGAARVAVKTVVLTIPAYYKVPVGTLRIKRGSVSFNGSSIVLAYEVFVTAAKTFFEDQWAEVLITGTGGGVDAIISTLRQGVGGFKTLTQGSSALGDEKPVAESPSTFTWTCEKDTYTKNTYTKTLSYVHDSAGVAQQVLLTIYNETTTHSTLTQNAGLSILYTQDTTAMNGAVLATSGFEIKSTKATISTLAHSGTGRIPVYPLTSSSSGTTDVEIEIKVDGQTTLTRSAALAGSSGHTIKSASGMYYIDGFVTHTAPNADLTTAAESPDEATASYVRANYDSSIPVNAVAEIEVGGIRQYPYVGLNLNDQVSISDPWHRRIEISRNAYDLYTVSYVDIDTSNTILDAQVLSHLTPYGAITVPLATVPSAAFEGSVACSSVETSALTFDGEGHAVSGTSVKYALLDSGIYKARRFV